MATDFIPDGDTDFSLGMDSNSHPDKLPAARYARGENVVNRGGIVQCRPGYRCLMALPEGNLQGFFIFRPKTGPEVLLFAVEGLLYKSDFPFNEFSQVTGVEFSPTARQMFWQQVEQSVIQNPDGSLSLINPRFLLVIQDGGTTPPAVYDGTTASHQRGPGKIPIGGPMIWIGGRLWVARDSLLFASDLENPISFTEPQYLGTVESFVLPDVITALSTAPTSVTDVPQLLVFTETTTTLIKAGIRDRTLWQATPDMQKLLLKFLGCESSRSLVETSGFLWWFAKQGLVSMDSALNARQSSRLPYRDAEMIESKARMSEDLTGIASASFENYLLVSVPYADKFNRHTWCMDQVPNASLNEESAPAWNSFWTGTRPVEWIVSDIRGKTRVLYISVNHGGGNMLWEAFTPDRLDGGCPISWWWETRSYAGPKSFDLRNKTFHFPDIFMTELLGEVDVAIFWAGTDRGPYKRISTKRFQATRGCFRPGMTIDPGSRIFAFKKQSRHIRTQDGKELIATYKFSSCDVEDEFEEFYDNSFQLLIAGSGPAAVKGIRAYLEAPRPEDTLKAFDPCESETEQNVVRFDGAAAESHEEFEAWRNLGEAPTEFLSTQVVSLTAGGFTEMGTGLGRSIVSQVDADKIAHCAATRDAANQLEKDLPRIVSQG